MKPIDELSIAKMVYDDWQQGQQRLRPLIEKYKEWDRQWDGVMPAKHFPWKGCSNLNVPITSSIGDTLLANITGVLIGQRPLIKVKPRGDTPIRNARIMEAVIDDQAYNDSNLFQTLLEAFHDGLRYGVWTLLVDWEEIEQEIPSRIAVPVVDEITKEVSFIEQTAVRTKRTMRPKIIPQNITQVVVSPNATCINKDGVGVAADYVIFRRFFKRDDLERKSVQNGGIYFNIDKLKPEYNRAEPDEILREKEERLGVNRYDPAAKSFDFEGLEGWYWHDIDGDGKDELCIFTVIISGGQPVLIRNQECPYLHYKIPLVWQKLFPDRGLYSRSIPSLLKDIQDEINTIHNQRRDAVSLSLLKMWKYRLGSRFDTNQELYPGCMIGVLDMQDFEPIVTYENGITPAISEEQLLNQYVERMTGITDYSYGRESASTSRPTATGTLALIQNANIRIDLIARYWRNGGLRELGKFIGELNQQFYPVENKLEPYDKSQFGENDLDQGMLQVLLSDLDGEFKYEYAGNHFLIDKNAERQQAVFLYDLLLNNPLIQNNAQSLFDLTRDLLQTYGKNDITITSPEELQNSKIEQIKQAIKEASIENRIAQIEQLKELIARQSVSDNAPAEKVSNGNQ